MKRLLPLLLLAGCSVAATESKPLVPLATTGMPSPTVTTPKPVREATFLRNFHKNYRLPNPYSDEQLVNYGWLWCAAYDEGMTTTDISARIEEGSSTQAEMDIQKIIVVNAFLDLCPS